MIVLCGASASGKTVTALDLQQRYGLVKAITTTTREKRVGETDGVEYFFVTKEEFQKRLENRVGKANAGDFGIKPLPPEEIDKTNNNKPQGKR